MTLRDFAEKTRGIAGKHGYAAAGRAAAAEATAKIAFRPYVRWREALVRADLDDQRTHLDHLRKGDEWLLIVLDAGRHDYLTPMLRSEFTGPVTPTFSAARSTFEWISTVWDGDHGDVTYLSGMVPVTDDTADISNEDFRRRYHGEDFIDSLGEIVKLWETDWDDTLATVPPEAITSAALDYLDRDKLVVHYNQPHSPYIGIPKLLGHSNTPSAKPNAYRPNDEPIWQRVRAGEVSDHELRLAYVGNAARAIAALEPLVRAAERPVAITADHGEALGEWGMYTHDHAPHPKRRVVPWQRVTGVAERGAGEGRDVDAKLRALGYR